MSEQIKWTYNAEGDLVRKTERNPETPEPSTTPRLSAIESIAAGFKKNEDDAVAELMKGVDGLSALAKKAAEIKEANKANPGMKFSDAEKDREAVLVLKAEYDASVAELKLKYGLKFSSRDNKELWARMQKHLVTRSENFKI